MYPDWLFVGGFDGLQTILSPAVFQTARQPGLSVMFAKTFVSTTIAEVGSQKVAACEVPCHRSQVTRVSTLFNCSTQSEGAKGAGNGVPEVHLLGLGCSHEPAVQLCSHSWPLGL
jgi:hypothetical protein